MDFKTYLDTLEKPAAFEATGITREFYLDVVELCVNAYPREAIERKVQKYERERINDPHAFSRLTSALGILLASGRKKDFYGLWEKMMDQCCRDLPKITGDIRVDFCVKEIMLAYKAMKGRIPEARKQQWLEGLGKIDPYINYCSLARKDEDKGSLHNVNIYNMAGEYLRESEDLTDTREYFQKHWPSQLENFDENGMYKDPSCPMLYDLTTRCQIQLILGFGYRGEFSGALDERLKKAGLWTLFMQSAAFEFPYGGRSNQFIFNEALIAANCEYEASRYKKLGDLKLAGSFKRSARLAACSIKRWLEVHPPKHIKNFFPVESLYGTEDYGYYDKYMVTLGCFIYIAYLFSDDSIEEFPCPAETGGFAFSTSPSFHKIFANCCGQSIEIDTKADLHYDSTGLGRYHKKGVPTELALSVPFTATPSYNLSEGLKSRNQTIGPGWEMENSELQFLSGLSEGLEHTVEFSEITRDRIKFSVLYSGKAFNGCQGVRESYLLDKNGLEIQVELIEPKTNRLYFTVPLFLNNGKDSSCVSSSDSGIAVILKDYKYIALSGTKVNMEEEKVGNRNGEYGIAQFTSDSGSMAIRLQLDA